MFGSFVGISALVLSFGLAQSLPVIDEVVAAGHIVSIQGAVYSLSAIEYDPNIYGVVTTNPNLLLDIPDLANKQAVLSSGIAKVTVSAANGPIESGDFITSSSTPGVGMKALRPGFVLGVAQESFTPSEAEVGQVEVALKPHFANQVGPASEASNLSGLLSDFLNISAVGITDEPSTALRWGVATLLLLITLIVSLLVFGRVAVNGIAAMGRNPLARYAIGFTVALNVLITLMVLGMGLALSYLVLVL